MPYNPIKAFLFLFYLQITFRTETHKERSSQTRKRKKRERKNDSQTQRPNPRCNGEIAPLSSQFVLWISLFLDLPLPFELGLIVTAPCRAISPLIEPSHLSLFLLLSIWPDLMIFFFWVLFVFLYWGMNDIIYLFSSWENVSNN